MFYVALLNIEAHWPILVAIAVMALMLLIVILTFIISEHRNIIYRQTLVEQSNSIRVFILDLKRNHVKYFNVTTIRDVHECSLIEFYQKFPISDQKRVINWVNALADPTSKAPEFLETGIQESHTRKQYFSMLQLDSIPDPDHQVIHLLSYLLKYMSGSKNETISASHGISTMKAAEEAFLASGSRHGATIAFRFCYFRDEDKEIERLAFNQLKNALFPFLHPKRCLLQNEGKELILVDFRVDDHPKVAFLLSSCTVALHRYLSLNGLSSKIEVRAGIVEHRRFNKDFKDIVDTALNLAKDAYSEKVPEIWYEKGHAFSRPTTDTSYRTEVERIISEKRLAYQFRPVYAVNEDAMTGFLTRAEPQGTFFNSIDELKDYALRTEDDLALFNTITKETISRFVSERLHESQKLFFPIRLTERRYILTSSMPKARLAHLVLVFSESDIKEHLETVDLDDVISDLRDLQAKGYEVCLLLSSDKLQLPSEEIYANFNYFICSFADAGITDLEKVRFKLHSLVERLLKYKKPIIASDLDGWNAIEVVVRSGLAYISAEMFAPYDVMMSPINPKSLKRVKDMKS